MYRRPPYPPARRPRPRWPPLPHRLRAPGALAAGCPAVNAGSVTAGRPVCERPDQPLTDFPRNHRAERSRPHHRRPARRNVSGPGRLPAGSAFVCLASIASAVRPGRCSRTCLPRPSGAPRCRCGFRPRRWCAEPERAVRLRGRAGNALRPALEGVARARPTTPRSSPRKFERQGHWSEFPSPRAGTQVASVGPVTDAPGRSGRSSTEVRPSARGPPRGRGPRR